MHTLMANIAHNTLAVEEGSISTTNTHKKC